MADIDPIKAILGLVSVFFSVLLVIFLFSYTNDTLIKDKCQPYQQQIDQNQITITSLNLTVNQTNKLLQECKDNYLELIKQNITKKDIEEIKGYYNITQIQIGELNQKFEQINTNYLKIYNTIINKYDISFALNIVFSIEILSFLFLKNEFALIVINWFKRKKKGSETNKIPIKTI